MKWNEETQSLEVDETKGYTYTFVLEINKQLKEWFDKQERVYRSHDDVIGRWSTVIREKDAKYQALLIGITEIKPETAEDLLKEFLEISTSFEKRNQFKDNLNVLIDKTKKFLEKK